MTIPLEIVEATGSTSEDLKRRATAGSGETALMARHQTAGRGRLGRTWHSTPGNLALSVLLRPKAPIRPGHWASLTAVALAETLRPLAPGLRLKWPNDVLLHGAKLAGILLEAGHDHGPWLVAGFGVNLASAPHDTGRPVTHLRAAEPPDTVAARLLTTLQIWRNRYEAEGYAPIRTAWLATGPTQGTPIGQGTFAGLDDNGAILLQTPTGPQTITSGEP